MPGIYIGATLTEVSRSKLYEFMRTQLDNIYSEYHTTIVYSRKLFPVELGMREESMVAHPMHYECFDTPHGRCLVLKVSCPKMQEMHMNYRDLGAQHSYSDYIPHITLCYGFDGDITQLQIPTLHIEYDKIEIKQFTEEYKPPKTIAK